MSVRLVDTVDVYKQGELVGALTRTSHGARLSYTEAYVAAHQGDVRRGVSFSLPPRREPYEVFGTNLHPFFAGLLPEGLRLRALVRALKTSEDDLFSLLVASGDDTVGDVSVARAGQAPEQRAPVTDTAALSRASFRALFEESLRYDTGPGDAAIAGVQPKVSAARISFPVRARDKRRAYILKLTPAEYPRLVENEAFFMGVAKMAGFPVAPVKVVHDSEGQSALLVERFDRLPERGGLLGRLHQEDACQLLDRYPADKYRLSLREVADALEICSAPLAERLKLLRLQTFSYLIANGDLHGKNVSVRVVDARVELTPAYDLLSTLPYGDRSMSLSMDGRDDKLRRSHFVAFGERVGLRPQAVEAMLDTLLRRLSPALARLSEIGLDEKKTEHLARTMRERMLAIAR